MQYARRDGSSHLGVQASDSEGSPLGSPLSHQPPRDLDIVIAEIRQSLAPTESGGYRTGSGVAASLVSDVAAVGGNRNSGVDLSSAGIALGVASLLFRPGVARRVGGWLMRAYRWYVGHPTYRIAINGGALVLTVLLLMA